MSQENNIIIVTGAYGFIGSHLVKDLLQNTSYNIIAVDDMSTGTWKRLPIISQRLTIWNSLQDVLTLNYNISQELFEQLLSKIKCVFHFAANTNTLEQDESIFVDNLNDANTIALSAFSWGARLIFASSASIYGKPLNQQKKEPFTDCQYDKVKQHGFTGPLCAYAHYKLTAESVINNAVKISSDSKYNILRFFNVCGPNEMKDERSSIISQFIRQAKGDGEINLFEGTLKDCRDYIHIDDVIGVLRGAMNNKLPNGTYNVGGGKAMSFETIIKYCKKKYGKVNTNIIEHECPEQYQDWTCADVSKIKHFIKNFRPKTGNRLLTKLTNEIQEVDKEQ